VLAYAEGLDDAHRQQQARDLIVSIPLGHIVIPVQVLSEVFNVLRRKLRLTPAEARQRIETSQAISNAVDTTGPLLATAMQIVTAHQFSIWDAIILAAASHAGCEVLISEDMHHGFTWGGVTIVNPFAAPRHPLLDDLRRP
jgi:predicted nucleic acid-binding protein